MIQTTIERVPPVDALESGIRLRLTGRAGPPLRRTGEPVTFGVPLPRSAAAPGTAFRLLGPGGGVPTAASALELWPDGSIKWLLVDGQVDWDPHSDLDYRLVRGTHAPQTPIRVERRDRALTLSTGRLVLDLRAGGCALFERVLVDGRPALDHQGARLMIHDQLAPCDVTLSHLEIESANELRATAVARGSAQSSSGQPLDLLLRIDVYAGCPTVRLQVRVRNPRRAVHQGGFWDLGDPGSMLLRELSLDLKLPGGSGPTQLWCSAELGEPLLRLAAPAVLYQDSSGGDNWASSNHVNRNRVVSNSFRGYRLETTDGVREAFRATPVMTIEHAVGQLSVAVPYFWQNFPKAIRSSGDRLSIALFPREYRDLHEIQGGEQKTHEMFLSFARDGITMEPLAWCRDRLIARADPEWQAATGAIPYLRPAGEAATAGHDALVQCAIEGENTFEAKRERIDQFGWRHFGEIYGDHEGVRRTSGPPLVSHYNNQYDPIAGFARQFLRSGDTRWWTQMDELASHVVDIDVYHTSEDKSAYNNGLFWHTYHYGDADTATHRTYPRAGAAQTPGGGPSGEHNYATGLALHYRLTGTIDSRDTAIGLGQYVIDADDGSKTLFRWLHRGPTGYPTASGSFAYHGPGRGSGNSLAALLDAFELTGERRFLDKAEEIIRRCIHPRDDIAARDLLDTERKWFYTMFLQSLGRYLDVKAEREELDAAFAYGQASLLHYARWMAEHEYPYLDHPERLEFPTETWAAQDIRKSDVFYYAMKHAAGGERERFRERGAFFHDYAVRTLSAMPTKVLARPVVILLANGALHGSLAADAEPYAAPRVELGTVGLPVKFVPQRARARRRAMRLAVFMLAMLVAAAALLLVG